MIWDKRPEYSLKHPAQKSEVDVLPGEGGGQLAT